jgi:uncharacterized membrane protein
MPAPRSPLASRRFVVGVLAAIVLSGLALRGYRLSARSFWFDEAFSWRLIQFPFLEMLERTGRDNHPPLYFILLRGWAAVFGTSAVALRSLSVVLGGLTIIGMYLFGTEAFPDDDQGNRRGRRIGLVVAALVALSVFQIRWAWETRMYTLGTALAAFSSWALLRALHAPPRSLRPWVLYGLLTLLFAYTHYYALFSIAAQTLFLAGYLLVQARGRVSLVLRQPVLWHALLAGAIVAVGWLPWAPTFLKQRQQVQAGYWSQPVTFWQVPYGCYQMLVDPQDAVFSPSASLLALGFCGTVLLAVLWKARTGEWYVFAAVAGPFALSLLVSLLDTKVFHVKFFLFAHLFFLAALGVLLGRVPFRLGRGLVCGGVLAAFLVASVGFWQKLDIPSKGGARGAAALIASQRQPGEPVVVCSSLLYDAMVFHAQDRSGWFLFNEGREVPHDEGAAVLTPDVVITPPQLKGMNAQRVWAVDMVGGSYFGRRAVSVPNDWTQISREGFPEVYGFQGEIEVVEYQVSRGR